MILISIEDGTCPSSTNLIKSIRAENFFISPATRSFDETQRKSTLSSTPSPPPYPNFTIVLFVPERSSRRHVCISCRPGLVSSSSREGRGDCINRIWSMINVRTIKKIQLPFFFYFTLPCWSPLRQFTALYWSIRTDKTDTQEVRPTVKRDSSCVPLIWLLYLKKKKKTKHQKGKEKGSPEFPTPP